MVDFSEEVRARLSLRDDSDLEETINRYEGYDFLELSRSLKDFHIASRDLISEYSPKIAKDAVEYSDNCLREINILTQEKGLSKTLLGYIEDYLIECDTCLSNLSGIKETRRYAFRIRQSRDALRRSNWLKLSA